MMCAGALGDQNDNRQDKTPVQFERYHNVNSRSSYQLQDVNLQTRAGADSSGALADHQRHRKYDYSFGARRSIIGERHYAYNQRMETQHV